MTILTPADVKLLRSNPRPIKNAPRGADGREMTKITLVTFVGADRPANRHFQWLRAHNARLIARKAGWNGEIELSHAWADQGGRGEEIRIVATEKA